MEEAGRTPYFSAKPSLGRKAHLLRKLGLLILMPFAAIASNLLFSFILFTLVMGPIGFSLFMAGPTEDIFYISTALIGILPLAVIWFFASIQRLRNMGLSRWFAVLDIAILGCFFSDYSILSYAFLGVFVIFELFLFFVQSHPLTGDVNARPTAKLGWFFKICGVFATAMLVCAVLAPVPFEKQVNRQLKDLYYDRGVMTLTDIFGDIEHNAYVILLPACILNSTAISDGEKELTDEFLKQFAAYAPKNSNTSVILITDGSGQVIKHVTLKQVLRSNLTMNNCNILLREAYIIYYRAEKSIPFLKLVSINNLEDRREKQIMSDYLNNK